MRILLNVWMKYQFSCNQKHKLKKKCEKVNKNSEWLRIKPNWIDDDMRERKRQRLRAVRTYSRRTLYTTCIKTQPIWNGINFWCEFIEDDSLRFHVIQSNAFSLLIESDFFPTWLCYTTTSTTPIKCTNAPKLRNWAKKLKKKNIVK